MNIKNLFAMVLALFALTCNLSTTFAADTSKKSNNQPKSVVKKAIPVVKKAVPVKSAATAKVTKTETRYRATSEFTTLEKVGFTQPQYKGPATLNGLGLKSAAELGLDGKKVYNEYENSARIVILSPFAKVYYDTGSLEPLYLAGCLRDGKSFANRIKLLEPVKAPEVKSVQTPTPVPVIVSVPLPEKPFVYQLPKVVETVVVQEKDIVVPVYYPKYEVVVHKQNIVYQNEPQVIPVQVYEQPRMVAGPSQQIPVQMPVQRLAPPQQMFAPLQRGICAPGGYSQRPVQQRSGGGSVQNQTQQQNQQVMISNQNRAGNNNSVRVQQRR
jgi:hypothetical protein